MGKIFSAKLLFKVAAVLFVVICLTTLVETIVCICQAPGEGEESWFLFLAQNRVCENFSFVPLYFSILPSCLLRYFPCRIMLQTMGFVSFLFFIFTVAYYCKCTLEIKLSKWRYVCLCMLPIISAASQSVYQADYGSSSLMLLMLVISLMLLSLTGDTVKHLVCSGLAGALMFQAVMIRPPLGLLALGICGIFFLHSCRWGIFYLVGASVGFIFFIFFITAPVEFLSVINSFLSSSAATTDGHDGKLLITSTIQIILYMVPCIVFGLVLYFLERINSKHLLIKRLLMSFMLLFLFLHCYYSLTTGLNLWANRRVDVMCVFVIFFYSMAKFLPSCDYKSIAVLCFLPFVPIVMGIGTTTPFDCEACCYLILVSAFIVISLDGKVNKAILLLVVFVLFSYQFIMFGHLKHRKWSNHQRFIDSTERLMDTNLVATPEFCDYLRRVDLETQNRPYVLGGPTQWAIVELLHKVPLSTSFRLSSKNIVNEIARLKPQKEQFFILKDQCIHFEDSEIVDMCNAVNASQCVKIKLNQDRSILIFL